MIVVPAIDIRHGRVVRLKQGQLQEERVYGSAPDEAAASWEEQGAERLHVVIDCGNGAAGLVAKEALEILGCRVTGLYCDVDGRFPNHHPDPTVLENLDDLVKSVKQHKADVGIGYDGDADRIGTIDEQGQVLWGDRLMVVYSRDILAVMPALRRESERSQMVCAQVAKTSIQLLCVKSPYNLRL